MTSAPVVDSETGSLSSMSALIAASAPANRLATACDSGDIPSAIAAVADGASVNKEGITRGWLLLPLTAAVRNKDLPVVVWLLSVGADPNGDDVMWYGSIESTAAILQLLIDAGGDVSGESDGVPRLHAAVADNNEGKVRALLAQPSLDLTAICDDQTAEQSARSRCRTALADMIAQEVRETFVVVACVPLRLPLTVLRLLYAGRETSIAGTIRDCSP